MTGFRLHATRLVFVVLVACGLALLLYPQATAWYRQRLDAQRFNAFQAASAAHTETDLAQAQREAVAYNANLLAAPSGHIDATKAQLDWAYQSAMRMPGTEVIAWVNIPKLEVDLPIFHGTDTETLLHGAGHLYGTSLPVGGVGTHSVLTAHSGLSDAEMFTHISELEIGDEFVITSLGTDLYYRVDQINTVVPTDVRFLQIEPDKDLVTLVTCTPIGINSHRLMVRGERIAGPAEPASVLLDLEFPWWAVIYVGTVGASVVGARTLVRKPSGAPALGGAK